MHKFVVVSTETELPSSSASGNSECNPTFEVSSEACISETRPIDGEQDEEEEEKEEKEQVENQKVESATEDGDCENTEDRDSPLRRTDLDVKVLDDIALWPTILTDAMIDHILRNKPKNIGNIEALKSAYKDRDEVYYRGLSYDHFYRIKTNGIKEEINWLVFSETSKSIYCYPCKRFSSSESKLIMGFQNWKSNFIRPRSSKRAILDMCTL